MITASAVCTFYGMVTFYANAYLSAKFRDHGKCGINIFFAVCRSIFFTVCSKKRGALYGLAVAVTLYGKLFSANAHF